MKYYNLTVHYKNDPNDELGFEEELEDENIEAVIEYVRGFDDFDEIYYFVIESEDGSEYYNTSEEEGFIPE